ncbi:MAG: hypothetical protein EUB_01835 [Eubacterium sp.]|uniref:prepilin-type N-terminal cleavage/methylation domain-containing protein n=1 Tax=Eubacterium sp. TaxID=142586 RepID=UPI00302878A2
MKKQWKLDNKGMTLLEVIVAFAIFAIAATILITGFNGALKVMGNSEAIKNASQGNASGLESPLEVIEEEGYKVETLEEPKEIRVTINGSKYLIKGKYKKATTTKTSDKMDMSMMLFVADEQMSAPEPEKPTPPSSQDKIPTVPVKSDKDAYWTPDPDLKSNNYNFYFNNDGRLETSSFNAWDSNGYVKTYGELYKGVITNQIALTTNAGEVNSEYLQQLFFISEEPFIGKMDGKVKYNVEFMYLDGNKMSIAQCFNRYTNAITQRTTSIKLSSFDTDNKTTILYLAQNMTITVNCYYDDNNSLYKTFVTVLPKGYYEVPNNTDILKAAYEPVEYAKYTQPVSENTASYQRTYSDIKERLDKSNVIVKENN